VTRPGPDAAAGADVERLKVRLSEFNARHRFMCSIVSMAPGRIVLVVGDAKAPEWDDPFNMLFRDEETVANTHRYMDGQDAPRSFRQGTRSCSLLRPVDSIIIGCVSDDSRLVHELFDALDIAQEEAGEILRECGLTQMHRESPSRLK
jgi:hypothetical protein